ncbi:hypothetical protein AciPR4_2011 [Terriglobus saanensis SP1PR4]|uniref:Uncharacterized protein n=1 Tax=Terriglobus saanensis (strain ATCC BAA-1853 / DSM 23119 / SP1PR4) TaxID=401053 RepID=E8V7A2_TERSS|nr:hypothetical protein AciPR4_2011 [Terriglobus saanensis SP1PR4]
MNRVMRFLLFFGFASSLALGQTDQPPIRTASELALHTEVHRLLLLSLQLQGNVQKTQRFELSIPVVQEAAQIESLARALRTQQPAR